MNLKIEKLSSKIFVPIFSNYNFKLKEYFLIEETSNENITGINYLTSLKILVLRENNLSKIDAINKMENLTFLPA